MRYLIVFLIGFGFGWLACGVREAGRRFRTWGVPYVFHGVTSSHPLDEACPYDQDEELP